jgi:hypothetical protein
MKTVDKDRCDRALGLPVVEVEITSTEWMVPAGDSQLPALVAKVDEKNE